MFFYWNDWNVAHIGKHMVDPVEAEYVARRARRPYPRSAGKDKYIVKGRTITGRWIQVIYTRRAAEDIDMTLLSPLEQIALLEGEAAAYVIHARELRRGER